MTGNPRASARVQGAPNEPRDERELDRLAVRRALAGDRDAFGEIVHRWQDRIHALIQRMTRDADLASDLAQETFVRAWQGLPSFEGGAALGTWLHTIAINQVRSEMRKRGAIKRGDAASLDAMAGDEGGGYEPPAAGGDPSVPAEERERAAMLHAAIAALDPEFREALVLREFQGLEYDEIAEATGVPMGTVRSRLFRARSELARRLEGRV